MIVLVWLLNFAISWLNAYGCGKSWNESKHVGGFPHLLNWCGAIMSACGFTWCYLVVGGFAGATIPVEHDDGTVAPFLSQEAIQALFDLGYLAIIAPVIGSGIVITINSWRKFAERRSFANGAEAGWNSFAQLYNMGNAVSQIPDSLSGVSSFFGGDSKSKDKAAVAFLVALCALAGILTTYTIITRTARSALREKRFEYSWRQAS